MNSPVKQWYSSNTLNIKIITTIKIKTIKLESLAWKSFDGSQNNPKTCILTDFSPELRFANTVTELWNYLDAKWHVYTLE